MDFIGKGGNIAAQAVNRMGIAAAGYRHSQLAGHGHGKGVFLVRRAAVDHFHGIGQLKYRMGQGILRQLRQGFVGQGAVEIGAFPHMPAQDAAEGMGADHEPAGGPGRPAQFRRLMKPGLILIQPESQDMPQIGVGLHRPHQDHIMGGGEPRELMLVPGAAVFGQAKAAQPQPFRLQNQILRRQAAVGAALGGVDVQVKNASHTAPILTGDKALVKDGGVSLYLGFWRIAPFILNLLKDGYPKGKRKHFREKLPQGIDYVLNYSKIYNRFLANSGGGPPTVSPDS